METEIIFGGEVKALGNGKIGGYLVQFGDSNLTDLEGDYFTANTDFDLERSDKTTLYYNHALDPILKNRKLGTGTMKADEVGIWVEGQLDLRDDYEKAVYGMVKQKKLGWSSGTAPNLVSRKPVGNAFEILSWSLGLDASLTPTPAEPRNSAMTIKAWKEICPLKSLDDPMLNIDCRISMGGLDRLNSAMWDAAYQAIYETDEPVEDRIALWQACCATLSEKGSMLIQSCVQEDPAAMKSLAEKILGRKMRPANIREAEERLRDALHFTANEAKALLAKGWKAITREEEEPNTEQENWQAKLAAIELQLLEESLR